MHKSKPVIHILGGGVAGLSAAYYARRMLPAYKAIIYEAAAHTGGRSYSFYDSQLGCYIDNATHVILGANKQVGKFLKKPVFIKKTHFYDMRSGKLSAKPHKFIPHILLSMFNTPASDIGWQSVALIFRKLFPFFSPCCKLFHSGGNLGRDLLSSFHDVGDEVKTGWKLQKISVSGKRIDKLVFNRGEVSVAEKDIVISALDAKNYQKVFGGPAFEFNRIINIFYRTSVRLALPGKNPVLGVVNGLSHWLFVNDENIAVTISDAANIKLSADNLAREAWKEICRIRGVESAFLPAYRIMDYKNATIRQDKVNNRKRPATCFGSMQNLRLAGDWTMKNYPCSLEAAVASGLRSVKSI